MIEGRSMRGVAGLRAFYMYEKLLRLLQSAALMDNFLIQSEYDRGVLASR